MKRTTPPFCPNPLCRLHDRQQAAQATGAQGSWYWRKGVRRLQNGKNVQRYQCRSCHAYFSSRTFSVDYWEKRHLSYRRLLQMLVSCMSQRAIARAFGCSPKTVENKIGRLTRQAVGVKAALRAETLLAEDLVADGFESYTVSQYWPNNFHLLVGKESQFVYYLNYAQLRRKGRMSEGQKEKARRLREEVPLEPAQIRLRFTELSCELTRLQRSSPEKQSLYLHTDEKKEYAQVLGPLRYAGAAPRKGYRLIHRRTSGKARRDRNNPLFSVNYLDREIRKDLAEHVRESTRFGRNVNSAVGRMEVYLFFHNLLKPFRVNRAKCLYRSHAEAAGFDAKMLKRLLARCRRERFFMSHLSLDRHLELVWRRGYSTPGKIFTDPLPHYVFA